MHMQSNVSTPYIHVTSSKQIKHLAAQHVQRAGDVSRPHDGGRLARPSCCAVEPAAHSPNGARGHLVATPLEPTILLALCCCHLFPLTLESDRWSGGGRWCLVSPGRLVLGARRNRSSEIIVLERLRVLDSARREGS